MVKDSYIPEALTFIDSADIKLTGETCSVVCSQPAGSTLNMLNITWGFLIRFVNRPPFFFVAAKLDDFTEREFSAYHVRNVESSRPAIFS